MGLRSLKVVHCFHNFFRNENKLKFLVEQQMLENMGLIFPAMEVFLL